MRTDKMAGYQPGPFPPSSASCMPGIPDCADGPDLIQQWQASTGHIHSAPVVWKAADNRTLLFIMGEADRLKAFPFEGGKFNVAAVKQGGWTQPALKQVPLCQSPPGNHGMWMPGGQLTVSNNGSTPGTGIVWALVPANGDANSCRGVKGMLIALNADDVTKELWRSQGPSPGLADTKDSVGLLARSRSANRPLCGYCRMPSPFSATEDRGLSWSTELLPGCVRPEVKVDWPATPTAMLKLTKANPWPSVGIADEPDSKSGAFSPGGTKSHLGHHLKSQNRRAYPHANELSPYCQRDALPVCGTATPAVGR